MDGNIEPLIYVNILVWNGQRWLKKCLDSLLTGNYRNFKILAIDNNSKDRSIEIIRSGYPEVELIENERNFGFAEGQNVGIRQALKRGADYIVVLNQDIIADRQWLAELVEVAGRHPYFGVLAPMQYDYEGKNIDPVFLQVLNQNDDFRSDIANNTRLRRIYEVPDTFGAAMFFRRETFLKVGLFDPLFFMYSEEVDFFQRAQYRGIRTAVVTGSKINHWHVSSRPERKEALKISYFAYRNRYMAILKDPRQGFGANIRSWVRTLFLDIRKNCSSWGGLLSIALRLFLQIWLIAHIPVIAYKRSQESKMPCYL